MSWVEFYILKKRNAYFPGCLYTDFTVYRYIYIYILYTYKYIYVSTTKKQKQTRKKKANLTLQEKNLLRHIL